MAIGKGYFWGGLADSVKNMYNQDWNARMAEQARMASGLEADEERKEKRAQFDRMFPPGTPPKTDTLPKDLAAAQDAVNGAQKELDDALKRQSDTQMLSTPEQKMAMEAVIRNKSAYLDGLKKTRDSMLNKSATRQGASLIKPPTNTGADDAAVLRELFK